MNRIGHSLSRGCLLVSTAMGLACTAHAQSVSSPYLAGFRYTVGGLLTGKISPAPSGTSGFLATRNTYDANNRLQKVETGTLSAWQSDTVAPSAWSGFTIGSTTTYSYDAEGRKTQESVAGSDGVVGKVTQYSYDAFDRLICTAERMDPAQWSGQSDACIPQLNGPNGADRITQNAYDSLNHLIQVRRAFGVPGLEQAYATYSYNADGMQEYVIDANGNQAKQTYDGFDRKNGWYFPSTTGPSAFDGSSQPRALLTAGSVNMANGFETYQYDPNGNMTVRTLRNGIGSQITYTYDALNRLQAKSLPGGNPNLNSAYQYDLVGHLTLMTSSNSVYSTGTAYTYDFFGRLKTETETLSGINTHTMTSDYDSDGNRIKLSWDDAPFYVRYVYDGLNRMTDINEGVNGADTANLIHFVYDSLGRRQTLQRGNGTSTTYGYDPMSRLNDLQIKAGSTLTNKFGFSFTPASQIKQRTLSNSAFAWAGAVAVNRTYTPNGLNQYSAVTGIPTITYDPKGNLTTGGGQLYSYNAENELATQGTYRFYYDPHHRLLYSTQTGSRLLYDGTNLVAEYNSTGTVQRRYVFGPNQDEPLVWYEGSGTSSKRWLSADRQGSIVQVTDGAGATLATNTYDEYGIPANTHDANGNITGYSNLGRFQYTAQQWVPELAMYYYKARIYAPFFGRFLQTDPVGYGDQVNLYSYVGNDPVNHNDEGGAWSKAVHDRVFEMAVGNRVSAFERGLISHESVRQDMPWGNGSHNEMHFLRSPGGDPDVAKNAFRSYVNGQIDSARDLENHGHHNDALRAFARAGHAIADSYSPVHNDNGNPAVYDPRWSDPVQAAIHGHSPVDWAGHEGTADLSKPVEAKIEGDLTKVYDSIFEKIRPIRCKINEDGHLECS